MSSPLFLTRASMVAVCAGMLLGGSGADAAGAGGACLLIGDSTIVGSAGELQRLLGKDCVVAAKVGASTATVGGWSQPGPRYDLAVIGAGSNDADSPALRERLKRLRGNVNAGRVIWLAPYDPRARALVEQVAAQSGDLAVPLASFASRDGIHPTSYKLVAQRLLSGDAARALPRASSRPVRMAKASAPAAVPAPAAKAVPGGKATRVAYHDPRLALAVVARPSIARPVMMRPAIARPAIALPVIEARD